MSWQNVDTDCPEIVLKWLRDQSISLDGYRKINNFSNPHDEINCFLNPYEEITDKEILLKSKEWVLEELKSDIIDKDIKINKNGPNIINPFVYFPPLLYFKGKNMNIKFNKNINNILVLYRFIINNGKNFDRIEINNFDPQFSIDVYDINELKKYLKDFGYYSITIKNLPKEYYYDKLMEIYKSNLIKFEGCICFYEYGNNEPRCYTENDLCELYIEKGIIDPINNKEIEDEQYNILSIICRKYKLKKLLKIISKNTKNKFILCKNKLSELMIEKDRKEKMFVQLKIKKIYDFLYDLINGKENKDIINVKINELFEQNSSLYRKLNVIKNNKFTKDTVEDLLKKLNKDFNKVDHLLETFRCYTEFE